MQMFWSTPSRLSRGPVELIIVMVLRMLHGFKAFQASVLADNWNGTLWHWQDIMPA